MKSVVPAGIGRKLWGPDFRVPLLCALLVGLASGCASSFSPGDLSRAPSSLSTPTRAYLDALSERMKRIQEFEVIRKWAEERGLRVWLGGGSATGVASYVREELEDAGKNPKLFPYSYYDIYRSTQDADIVIAGGELEAQQLEALLKEKLSYLQGSKKLWEVRLLEQSRGSGVGKKDPIVGSADFRNQNSDSYSTGLVEITTPPKGESRVRDAFDWNNHSDSRFLTDLIDGEITFYRNELHHKTARAVAGYNPEIISVIRAMAKAFQYDAKIKDESLALMSKIVEEFDPRGKFSEEAKRYILANSAKVYQHSRDLEHSKNVLEKIGLLSKLAAFADANGDSKLKTLFGREPIRSYPLGKSNFFTDVGQADFGKTAAELKIKTVAHETSDFLAYENITMSRLGRPNFFISRKSASGEAAVFGDGAYTAKGRQGARGTKLTIRFEVDPRAVCGRDFFVAGDYVIFRNANAFRLLPEDRVSVSLRDFIALLEEGKFSGDDIGVMKKLELKALGQVHSFSQTEIDDVFQIVVKSLAAAKDKESASFAYLLKLAAVDPRLKALLTNALFRNSTLSPAAKFKISERYGLVEAYVADAIATKGEATALETILDRLGDTPLTVDEADAVRRLLDSVARTQPSRIRVVRRTTLESLGKTGKTRTWMEVFEKATELSPEERKVLAVKFLEARTHRDAQFSEWAEFLEKHGHGDEVFENVLHRLGKLTDYDWSSYTKNVETNLFGPLNRILEARKAALPGSARKWALDPRNPEYLKWFVFERDRGGNSVATLEALNKLGLGEPERWRVWRETFEKAKVKSPTEAKRLAIEFLGSQRALGDQYPSVVHFLNDSGYDVAVADELLKRLGKLSEHEWSYSKLTVNSNLFAPLNAFFEKQKSVPKGFEKWALDPRNPEYLQWVRKGAEKSGNYVGALQYLTKLGYSDAVRWVSWQVAFSETKTRSPVDAKRIAFEYLESLRSVGENFASAAYTLNRAGYSKEVTEAVVKRLGKLTEYEWLNQSAAIHENLFTPLNEYVAKQGTIPEFCRKWALDKRNPDYLKWTQFDTQTKGDFLEALRGLNKLGYKDAARWQVWQDTFGKARVQSPAEAKRLAFEYLGGLDFTSDHYTSAVWELNAAGYENAVAEDVLKRLGKVTDYQWSYQRNQVNENLFGTLNAYLAKRGSVPPEFQKWAIDARNPNYLEWTKRTSDASGDFVGALSRLNREGFSDAARWEVWKKTFEKTKAKSPEEAKRLGLEYLRAIDGPERHYSEAFGYMYSAGYADDAAEDVLKRLGKVTDYQWSYAKSNVDLNYFENLNFYLAKKGSIPEAFRKWAIDRRNPEYLRWTEFVTQTKGDFIEALRGLNKLGYKDAARWKVWQDTFGKARVQSPPEAKRLAFEYLRGLDPLEDHYTSAVWALNSAGYENEVAEDALKRLGKVTDYQWRYSTKAVEENLFGTLNGYLAKRGSIPPEFQKWAIDARNPKYLEWTAATSDASGDYVGALRRLNKEGYLDPARWSVWKATFEKARAKSPEEAKQLALEYLRSQDGLVDHYAEVHSYLRHAGYEDETARDLVAKLGKLSDYDWLNRSGPIQINLFGNLHAYLVRRGTVPSDYKKWAVDKRNPFAGDLAKLPVDPRPSFYQRCLRLLGRA